MGLFTQRPEQNEEWAGLPSEPLRPESAAERLGQLSGNAASVDVGESIESIVIPVAPFTQGAGPAPADADANETREQA
jgi:hypothetical protein